MVARIIVTFTTILMILNFIKLVQAESRVPCFFIFGDSLLDNGNNNNLNTTARANYPPYGVDFPGGPTGRFTNGRNMADILAHVLGFGNFIPPFASASGSDILQGVNYASGSAGIRNESGSHLMVGIVVIVMTVAIGRGGGDCDGKLVDGGLSFLNFPCCNVSKTVAEGQCVPNTAPCPIRAAHAFFDNFHPTETGTMVAILRAYYSLLPSDTYPMDINHLLLSGLLGG
ncbi:GDSL esterase/lipase [Capsicum annuum]|nr:GDSL esterase/lipase [Capsicum annuum]